MKLTNLKTDADFPFRGYSFNNLRFERSLGLLLVRARRVVAVNDLLLYTYLSTHVNSAQLRDEQRVGGSQQRRVAAGEH